MIIILSPAKKMRFDDEMNGISPTIPQFHEKTLPLIRKLSKFTKPKLMKLMSISADLANLNLERYRSFSENPEHGKLAPAIHAFNGDVYLGLDSATLDQNDLLYANDHLRILSGLYGYIRPSDQIQPYRLEMGSKLPVGRKKNLYAYWHDDLVKAIRDDLAAVEQRTIINLASQEYFKVVDESALDAHILTIHFREYRNGVLKAIQFNLKRARGLMARYIIKNKLKSIEGIKGFDTAGYSYEEEMSDATNWYFIK